MSTNAQNAYQAKTAPIITEKISAPAGITSFQKNPTNTSNPIITKIDSTVFTPYIYIITSLGYVSTGFWAEKPLQINDLQGLKRFCNSMT
jgi:hypothetical protein